MIGAVVLAAGQSRRMGTQKLLLPFAGTTLVGRVVGQVVASPVEHTVVVVSAADGAAVAAAVAPLGATVVTNEEARGDMLSSVRRGLRALPAASHGAVVVPGDLPGVTAGLVARLVEAFGPDRAPIVVPAHDGRRGHPLLFSARYFEEVLRQYDGVGLRGLLDAHPDDVVELPVADDGVLRDVDTPEDYRRALERMSED